MKFHCTECGICCRIVGKAIQNKADLEEPYKSAVEEFPYKADENGICEMLDRKTNKCKVYSTRPLLCNIVEIWKSYYKATMSKKEYFHQNAHACNMMITNAGLPKEFLIDLNRYI